MISLGGKFLLVRNLPDPERAVVKEEEEEIEPLDEILADVPREELSAPTMNFLLEEELFFCSLMASMLVFLWPGVYNHAFPPSSLL